MNLFAYLDPGTGSLVLQVIVGGILGIGVILKTYGNKIKSLFIKKSSTAEKTEKSDQK